MASSLPLMSSSSWLDSRLDDRTRFGRDSDGSVWTRRRDLRASDTDSGATSLCALCLRSSEILWELSVTDPEVQGSEHWRSGRSVAELFIEGLPSCLLMLERREPSLSNGLHGVSSPSVFGSTDALRGSSGTALCGAFHVIFRRGVALRLAFVENSSRWK